MEQIILAYGFPEETITAMMMLYRNTKVTVCLPAEDTTLFDIVAEVLQGDTFAHYLFIICLDYILQMSIDLIKENGFILKKGKKLTISCRNNNRCRLFR